MSTAKLDKARVMGTAAGSAGALLLASPLAWLASPWGFSSHAERDLLDTVRATAVAGTSAAKITLPAQRVCLLAFYVSREKLEVALGRPLTSKERVRWTLYGTEEDNMNVIALISRGELQTVAKFHHFDLLGGTTSFHQGCFTGSVLVLRATSTRAGQTYELIVEDERG